MVIVKSYVEEQVTINPDFFKLFIRYMKTVNDSDEVPLNQRKLKQLPTQKSKNTHPLTASK